MALTARDLDLLRFCAEHKGAPFDVVARRFFSTHPVTGEPNKDPAHACRRRVAELVKMGMVAQTPHRGRNTLVTVTKQAAIALGVPARTPVPQKGLAHHVNTLTYLQDLSDRYAREGVELKGLKLEFQIRALEQAGKQTRKGDDFDPFPDALFELERIGPDGTRYTEEVALEYVTVKYSDADIIAKRDSFSRYDNVVWVSDKPSTAQRVAYLTGRPSEVAR